MQYAENECALPIWLHCNELRALNLTTNALCRTVEIGALLLKCVLIVYIWPEKGVHRYLPKFKHSSAAKLVESETHMLKVDSSIHNQLTLQISSLWVPLGNRRICLSSAEFGFS